MTDSEESIDALAGVRLSIVVANYNGMATLPRMLTSLRGYPIQLEEIIVVDDGSTDGSQAWLRQQHPDVRLIAFESNTGNVARVRNTGLRAARGTHAFLTDNDIELLPGCLHRLLETMLEAPDVFCTTPRLVYRDRPDVIFQDGNGMHCLALGTGTRRGTPVTSFDVPEPFPTCGGGMMMLDLDKARAIGLFDEGYMHAWADDGELQLRGALYGYRCLHVAAAVATHAAKDHGTGRAFGQIYNRFRVLFTFFEARTLLVFAPSLVLFELALIAGSLAGGFFGAYRRAVALTWRNRREILSTRGRMQDRRRVADSEILRSGPFEVPGAVAPGTGGRVVLRVVQLLCDANWALVRGVDSLFRRVRHAAP